MKILFIQHVDDTRGGIINVNTKLMSQFIKEGHEVLLLSLRHDGANHDIKYPEGLKRHLINDQDIWKCPLLSEALEMFKSFHLIKGIKHIIARKKYKLVLQKDFELSKEYIRNQKPDVIINSHYETLDAIDESYLSKTIMHFHTSFDQVLKNHSYIDTFNRYKERIGKFVWLTQKTNERAKEAGLVNSCCIYNPISFHAKSCANLEQKHILFIGRLADEKRVDLAIKLFNQINLPDWQFDIYGFGKHEAEISTLADKYPNVHFLGATNNVEKTLKTGSILILTSSFEGMPLAVLEANECGIPCVAFDFGESSHEVIKNNETGFIVPQNDEEAFIKQLSLLMNDDKLREDFGQEAKYHAKQFSIEQISENWQKLFLELIDKF